MKKITKNKVIEKIINFNINFNPNKKGYVPDNVNHSNNLIEIFPNWEEILNELKKGNGNEVKLLKNNTIKFNALHSSSALCVNNFAPVKEKINNYKIFDFYNFNIALFEKKLFTGISRPNLDFYIESEEIKIGFESKYLEIIYAKLPTTNLSKYINRKELSYLPNKFNSIINKYLNYNKKLYLGLAE